ncbi:MAG: hypothetical protein Q9164_005663 [Protoblastenia rupestris]
MRLILHTTTPDLNTSKRPSYPSAGTSASPKPPVLNFLTPTLLRHSNPRMASSIASRRLFHEYKNLSTSPPDGITAGPISEDDIFVWEALIQGPEGTPYEGGIFPAELKFPKDYPLSPPSMRFLGEGGGVWHPNGASFPFGGV